MLSLHHRPDRLRRCDNLLPLREGGVGTRPGAVQVIAGPIAHAKPWGARILVEKGGRLAIWDGTETDLCAAGLVLQATAFQALTSGAAREDRLYVADGLRPLWFIARRAGVYEREDVTNAVLDEAGTPYPIPVPRQVKTWRNRLWLGIGTNRVQHCQNDAPAQWDPLWTVECQGSEPDAVRAIEPHGETLAVGLGKSLWGISGTSQFNFQRDQLVRIGVTGADALASDGERLMWISDGGVHRLGLTEPMTDDLRVLFAVPVGPADLVIDTRRRWVLALMAGRLFVMHLDREGVWGEITGVSASGLIRTTQYVGWFGADGLWLLMGRDTADKQLDGTERAVVSRYDTWDQRPNLNGRGRALCNRTILELRGSSRGAATYRLLAGDGNRIRQATHQLSLADETVDDWRDDIESAIPLEWPTRPVRRELVPRIAGETFRHVLTASCYMEVRAFEPRYRFGAEAAA